MPVVHYTLPFCRPKRALVSVALKRGYYVEPSSQPDGYGHSPIATEPFPPVYFKLAPSGVATRGPRSKYPCPFRSIIFFSPSLLSFQAARHETLLDRSVLSLGWDGGYSQQRSAGFSESRQGRQKGVKWRAKSCAPQTPGRGISFWSAGILAGTFFLFFSWKWC